MSAVRAAQRPWSNTCRLRCRLTAAGQGAGKVDQIRHPGRGKVDDLNRISVEHQSGAGAGGTQHRLHPGHQEWSPGSHQLR